MKFAHIFRPYYWTKLTKQGRPDSDDLRRDVLFSQIIIVGLIISIFHFATDLIYGDPIILIIDIFFSVFLVIFYYLNEHGSHRSAKFLNLTILNFFIFLLASILDERMRMGYNFFPLAILSFLVFYKTELMFSLFFSGISLLLLLILELTHYMPFGNLGLKSELNNITLIANVLGSFILVIMGLFFLVKLNLMAEAELKNKEDHLKKINTELDRFVYSASHDLRAPLLSIKGLANLLRYEIKEKKLIPYVDKIEGRISDMDHFISEIIDHSRNARTAVVIESVSLQELIYEVYEKLKYMDEAGEILFTQNLEINEILSDKSRLNVILSNLIANAIKYADQSKKEKKIEVFVRKSSRDYIIGVKDNGIGISEKHHQNIFDMFYRASDTSEGSGLGLYIVKEMVEKLGGTISLKSKIDEGSSFVLKLPVH